MMSTRALCVLAVAATLAAAAATAAADGAAADRPVQQRGLVSRQVTYDQVLAHHASHCQDVKHKHFSGETLAYVTPWNNHGYEVAKTFNAKFTYVSPVWLQVRVEEGRAVVAGTHDMDDEWIDAVRSCDGHEDRCPLVVPRVIVEVRGELTEQQQADMIGNLVDLAQEHALDGYVLEAEPINDSRMGLVREFAEQLHATPSSREGKNMVLIVVTQPIRTIQGVLRGMPAETFKELSEVADRLSVMTYDYSIISGEGGPNNPLDWQEGNVAMLTDGDEDIAQKILLGMPFYGYDDTQAIIGSGYLQLLEEHKPRLRWDKRASEHWFKYSGDGKKHIVYFPSLSAIQERLDFAEEFSTGISIWEVGQGLDYWFDLF